MAKNNRPKMNTKEELIEYLNGNEDELPFIESVWDRAVELTEKKERKFREVTETGYDGKTKTKKIPNGAVNPVGKYFQLIALPSIKKKAERELAIKSTEVSTNNEDTGDIYIDFDDEAKSEAVNDWVNMFFSEYPKSDKKFLVERLGDYYDNYELNDGADKMMAIKAVADELQIMNLTKLRAKGKDIEKTLEKVQKGYLSLLDSLKALKKQRGAMEDGKNKFVMWVDDLDRKGDFKPEKVEYDEDEISFLMREQEKAIRKVLRDG